MTWLYCVKGGHGYTEGKVDMAILRKTVDIRILMKGAT